MENILSALKAIDVSTLSRADWILVGMALKEENYPCSIWDDWSRNDSRYHPGECEKQWKSFHGSDSPVRGGTIIQMAKDRGWTIFGDDGCMNWDDTIEYDGEEGFNGFTPYDAWSPTEDLIRYLEVLFDKDDLVGYVTGDVWQDNTGKWLPSKGVYDRTAGELIASLRKYPDDIGATVGDWKQPAGAWIRFNPLDGEGVKNENVTRFKYALVESDSLSIADQDAAFRKLELPIAALVHSGGKSLHAIVRIDADSYPEYRKRVEFLYDFLEKNDVPIDKQNRNPSRLSRMPGVTRNGNRQYLVATNIGRKSWNDWMDYAEGVSDELPPIENLSDYLYNRPKLPDELIGGVLRCGHKMLISGSSKVGKSSMLMELCVSIAEGHSWLGLECKRGRVMYVNLEIDPASAVCRFLDIYKTLGIQNPMTDNIAIWNLRGHATPLDQLVPKLIRRVQNEKFDAVIIDPIYKVITGDENSASEMGYFCNQFDRICDSTGSSVIYCHHHSKGAQGSKRAMDRAAGSGVFARDPDALLDIIQLELPDHLKNSGQNGNATAWRMESSLREFANIKPINFWFDYPIHRLDTTGVLEKCYTEGSFEAIRARNRKSTTKEERKSSIDTAYDACSIEVPVTIDAMAEYLGVTPRCVRDRLSEFKKDYWYKGGIVGRTNEKKNNT